MFKKQSDSNDDVEIGGIIKKALIGGGFLLVAPILTLFAGVDVLQLCVTDIDGDCNVPSPEEGDANRLRAGFDKLKPLVVVLLDMFFVAIGLAILFGPGRQVFVYRLAVGDAPSR